MSKRSTWSGWAVIDPASGDIVGQVWRHRKNAIADACDEWCIGPWSAARRDGFRCVKVTITPAAPKEGPDA